MQSNGLGGSSLEKCIKSVFPTRLKFSNELIDGFLPKESKEVNDAICTILHFLAKLVRILILLVGNTVKIDSITFPK